MGVAEIRVVAALDRARGWLEHHRKSLLPDATLFWRLSFAVDRRPSDEARRWLPPPGPNPGGLLLSADYVMLARRVSALLARLPLSGAPYFMPKYGRLPLATRAMRLGHSIRVDAAFINLALAEAASGTMSARAERWSWDHASSTGYTLTHKLLACVLRAAASNDPALPARDVPVAQRVLAELYREIGATYVDLTAQRVACLALAGCPPDVLGGAIRWLVSHQGRAGDWHYFETEADAYETVARVHTSRSPLLRPPLWKDRRDPMLEAHTIELVHRGHATAVAAAALACFVSGSYSMPQTRMSIDRNSAVAESRCDDAAERCPAFSRTLASPQ
jgi:hypothetical protein